MKKFVLYNIKLMGTLLCFLLMLSQIAVAQRKLSLSDLVTLKALKASLDGTKSKYKDDAYDRKLMARLDFEAIILITAPSSPFHVNNKTPQLNSGFDKQNYLAAGPNYNPSNSFELAEQNQNDYFNIRTGLRIDGRGDKEIDDIATYTTSIYYLTLPVYFQYNHPNNNGDFFAGIGPYYGYALFGKFIDKVNGKTTKEKIKFGKDDDLKRGDIGLGFVAGYIYKHLLLQFSYDYGLRNITFDSNDVGVYTRAVGISVGYVLK